MNEEIKELEEKIAALTSPSIPKVDWMNRLAFLHFATNPVSSFEIANQSIAIAREINYKPGEAQGLLYAGMSKSSLRAYEEAKNIYAQCQIIFEELMDEEGLASVHSKMGNAKLYTGNYAEALEDYNTAIAIREKLNDATGAADLYANSGVIHGFQGNHLLALKSHLQALKTYERLNDLQRFASSANNIGLIYYEQKNFEEALKMFEHALQIRKDRNDQKAMSDLLGNIGMIYRAQSNFHEALDYYQQAQRLAEKIADKSKLGSCYINMGKVFKDLGQQSIAIAYYETALGLFKEVNEKRGVVQSYLNLGEIFLEKHEYDKAKDFLENAIKSSIEIGLKNYLRDALLSLSTLNAVQKNYEKAYENYVEYTSIDKEILNADTSKQIAQMSVRYEMEQKEREAELDRIRHDELKKSYELLDVEKKRSEDLLHNILPVEIADEIKRTGKTEARYYESATVMFCDIVGFTKISEQLTPKMLIYCIDFCYRKFDEIVEQFGIEKIKVIGDSYMCAGGLPVENKTHAIDMVKAAFAMRDFTLQFSKEQKEKGLPEFHFRFGIHTGSLVTGVVGQRKFTYDIWGDTVNVAARMEQSSETDRLNISESTFELIKEKFRCSPRGKIEAKNKGKIEMYFVEELLTL